MNNKIKTRIIPASLPPALKGKVTKPTVRLDDNRFHYVPKDRTDIRITLERARAALGVRKVEKVV